jgi:hypothetical protein
MLRKILFFALFHLFLTSAYATHIVGGEIEMRHISGNRYRFTLNLYFDDVNGLPDAKDAGFIFPAIFRKSDNKRIDTELMAMTRASDGVRYGFMFLSEISDTPIPYIDPKCAVGSLRTRHIIYSEDFILDPSFFSDPNGYYISWERCCRNNIIENIEEPGASGQTFYMEFPPIRQNSNNFINSTPRFPKANNPYACLNQPFTLSFAATDTDGDQLSYSLRTPTNGNSSPFDVIPWGMSAPYAPVKWLSGYGVNNMVKGNPPMQISSATGEMTFTASETGLFVFAVACEERRNGVKIGETVREFQIMVLDCGGNNAPTAKLKLIDSEEFYDVSDVLPIEVDATNKCTKLQVNDIDNNTKIKASIRALNFTDTTGILLQHTGTITNGKNDKLLLNVCFDKLPARCTPYEMEFTVVDNTCGSPLTGKQVIRVLIRDKQQAITPILECISYNEDGSRTATFGYENFNTSVINIAVGQNNKIVNANFSGQPSQFNTGRWYNMFQVNYKGNNIPSWEIITGTCNKNVSNNPVTICSTPCSPAKERFLLKDNHITFEEPESLKMVFQEGAYLERNEDGSAYIFGELKVAQSEVSDVPSGSLWRLRLNLKKSNKTFCPIQGEDVSKLITEQWDYFELDKTIFTQVKGNGQIGLAHRYGKDGKTYSQSDCNAFQLGTEANNKDGQIGLAGLFYFSINYRDRNTIGDISMDLEQACAPNIVCIDYAIKVVSYNEQKRKDGKDIDDTPTRKRNNPENTLGAPQENDTYNFVSLGFGGSIVLELGSPVYDHNKYGYKAGHKNTLLGKAVSFADLIVVETSFGRINQSCGDNEDENYPERARIYGTESLDKNWVLLGEGCRTNFVDVAPAIQAGHRFVKYLKIEDVSDISKFSAKDEGYDVDGIIICPEAVKQAIMGDDTRMALLDARVEEKTNKFNIEFFNQAPNQDLRFDVMLYPNPVKDYANFYLSIPESNTVEISIFDITGRMFKNNIQHLNAGTHQIQIAMEEANKGLYIIKVHSKDGQNSIFKIVKD